MSPEYPHEARVDRVLRLSACVLAAIGVSAYVAAKVHFFTAFDPANLAGYWAEHWIYSAVLGLTVAMLGGVVALMRRRPGTAPPERQSNNELQRTRPAQATEPRR